MTRSHGSPAPTGPAPSETQSGDPHEATDSFPEELLAVRRSWARSRIVAAGR